MKRIWEIPVKIASRSDTYFFLVKSQKAYLLSKRLRPIQLTVELICRIKNVNNSLNVLARHMSRKHIIRSKIMPVIEFLF